MTKLTKRQNEILNLIQSHMAATGSPPTRAEIAKTMGFKSPNAAEDHLRALARKGVIELIPGTSRGIRLTKPSGVPIIARVSPKQAILSEDNLEGSSRIDGHLFNPAIDFLYRVPNDLPAFSILAGDYLAIHQTNKVEVGQIAVFRTNHDLGLKRITEETNKLENSIEGLVVGVIRNLSSQSLA